MVEDSPKVEMESAADYAMARAVLYRVVSASLLPPLGQGFEALRGDDTLAEALLAAGRLDEEAIACTGSNPDCQIKQPVDRWVNAIAIAKPSELMSEFERLFGHSLRARIVPYETEYGPDSAFRQSDELADIGGFYQAFGLTLTQESGERCDHLAVECEFLSFLARKEALFRRNGVAESSEVIRDAHKQFFRDHFGCFARAVAEGLASNAGHEFYRAVGELLTALVCHGETALSAPLGAGYMALRPDVEDDVPMACGSCELLSNTEDT